MCIDVDKVEQLIKDKFITRRKHPTEQLWVLNYTPKTQIENNWTRDTMNCRGLIVDENWMIISRPFSKFFSYDQVESDQKTLCPLFGLKFKDLGNQTVVKCTEKLDGSLGILYPLSDGTFAISTRGSFTSPQAKEATKIWREKHADFVPQQGFSYVFEIICPSSRVVVNYEGERDVHLLAVIDNYTGMDRWDIYDSITNIKKPNVVELSDPNQPGELTLEEVATAKWPEDETLNKEGFVFILQNGLRVKYKHDEYKRLHRIMSNFSPKTVWKAMQEGANLDEFLKGTPDEFYKEVTEIKKGIDSGVAQILTDAQKVVADTFHLPTKKEKALIICQHPLKKVIFALAKGDEDSAKAIAYKMMEPATATPIATEEDLLAIAK